MHADVSSIPPNISVWRVFPSTAERLACQATPSRIILSAQACSRHTLTIVRFAFALRASRGSCDIPLGVGIACSTMHHRGGWVVLRPRGPRSGSGCSVPFRHHLIGLIRPTRRHIATPRPVHRRLIGASPSLCGSRLGDPRVVPGFRCPFFSNMPLSMTPGSFVHRRGSVSACRAWPSPGSEQLGTPVDPAIRFTQGPYFGASRFTYATACQIARPPATDQTGSPRPQRAFTSRLPAGRSPFLPLDITYNSGLNSFCWPDVSTR